MESTSQTTLQFSPIAHKSVEAAFDGGAITSDAGVLLLRETDRQIGLIDSLVEAIRDTRDSRYVRHELKELLTQRIIQIACGYEDADDCDELRTDPAFKMAAGHYPETGEDLASQPTISRFENMVSRTDLYRMAEVLVDKFIASYPEPPSIVVIDSDTTDDPTHGDQQLSLFNGYYDEHCYLPLHVFEGLSGKLITSILRPGKTPTGREVLAVLKRVVRKLREAWGDKTIIVFRGDSHFAKPEVMDWAEDNGVLYILGLGKNSVLARLSAPLLEKAKELYNHRQSKV